MWENGCEDYSFQVCNYSGFDEEKNSEMTAKYKWSTEEHHWVALMQ